MSTALLHTGGKSKKATLSKKKLLPYWLLAPGIIWLLIFFLVPIYQLISTSTQTQGFGIGTYVQTYRFANFIDAITSSRAQLFRSFEYAFLATAFALVISYPLAYAVAFKSGRWKNTLLVLIVAPFFCSFLLRTVAWEQILGEQGLVIKVLRFLHVLGAQGHLTATPVSYTHLTLPTKRIV